MHQAVLLTFVVLKKTLMKMKKYSLECFLIIVIVLQLFRLDVVYHCKLGWKGVSEVGGEVGKGEGGESQWEALSIPISAHSQFVTASWAWREYQRQHGGGGRERGRESMKSFIHPHICPTVGNKALIRGFCHIVPNAMCHNFLIFFVL